MTLDGKRALVIGGSSGIGLAAARKFAGAGATVLINGRNRDKLDAAVAELGDGAVALAGDARSDDDVRRVIEAAAPIDHLVLAASGTAGGGPLESLDHAALVDAFDAKFWVHLRVLRAAVPALAPDASVTFVTAGSARAALPGTAGLAAINGAIEAMVGPLAAELAPCRINAVSPGVIRTGWWNGMPEPDREELFSGFEAALPVQRIGEPDDVAQAIFLCATNGYMTGTVLDCAGGGQLATGAGIG
jgi:NAD(P)-dependent dehydrogenase (short-subunit alcohol dehydrogenase family)